MPVVFSSLFSSPAIGPDGSDPEQVIALLLKTAEAHPKVTKDPPPDAVLKQFGEDALVFVLGFTTEEVAQFAFVQSDVAVAVNAWRLISGQRSANSGLIRNFAVMKII